MFSIQCALRRSIDFATRPALDRNEATEWTRNCTLPTCRVARARRSKVRDAIEHFQTRPTSHLNDLALFAPKAGPGPSQPLRCGKSDRALINHSCAVFCPKHGSRWKITYVHR